MASSLFHHMRVLKTDRSQKFINESMQGEAHILFFIAAHGCGVLPGEIGSAMNVSSARVAQALNNMEHKGWIIRRIDPEDRRRILVSITPEGKTVADMHHQAVVGLVAGMLRLLGERDAEEYVRITGKLAGILAKHEESMIRLFQKMEDD